jgi:hypothetical protein
LVGRAAFVRNASVHRAFLKARQGSLWRGACTRSRHVKCGNC